jgi:hypothetical protein
VGSSPTAPTKPDQIFGQVIFLPYIWYIKYLKMIQETLLTKDFIEVKKSTLKSKIENLMSKSDDEVIQFFSDYIAWNGVFGGAVASLAGKWHNAVHLTDMSEDETTGLNKFAHRIASEIFAAAEDEFNDENNTNPYHRIAHKEMAWDFFQGIMEYYNIKNRPKPSSNVKDHIQSTLRGYGVSNRLQLLKTLIYNLGFHIGSEKIASFEFDFLTAELKKTRPELFKFLSNRNMFYGLEDNGIKSIDWLKVHGTVEEEHFQHAITAARWAEQMVIEHDIMSRDEFNSRLVKGLMSFSYTQEAVFEKY